jgi:uncharacterized protein YndB with AHSA1/START domain
MTTSEQIEKREMVVSRLFNAPREQVWSAFTEPEMIMQWWGPLGFTAPTVESERRAGGRYLYDMRAPDGKDYWSAGVYREFVPPERIVAIDSFADEEGNIVPASYYGMSTDWPLESEVIFTFEDVDGRTRLTVRQPGVPSGADVDKAVTGWNQSFDKLQELLEGSAGRCRERVHGGIRREED